MFINICCFGGTYGGQFQHLQSARQATSAYISSTSACRAPWCYSFRGARWQPRHRNSTSAFGFREFAHMRRSKSTRILNFGKIPQSMAEILGLLPVSENKRPPCWNSTFGSDFHVCVTIGMPFCICLPNFVQIGLSVTELWRHIHFKDGGRGIAILLPVSVFMTSLIWEGINLPAYQISAKYLNPRLRYYYFRILKRNVRHVGILLPVPIFTFASPSACHSASAYQMSSKSGHPRSTELWRRIHFSRWRPSAILNYL